MISFANFAQLDSTARLIIDQGVLMRTNLVRLSLFVCLLLAFAPFAFGQSSNGSISGTITDDSGAALPGVTVSATNIATGIERNAVTNQTGHYEIALLPPGTYNVSAE